MKASHARTPYSLERKKKIGKALAGKPKSERARANMSEAKKAFFQTAEGQALRAKLSRLASLGHAQHKFENAKRNGYYFSTRGQKLVFYGSSYELRLCWMLDRNEAVEEYDTQIYYEVEGRGRCLDFLVTYKTGGKEAIEVKPMSRLTEQANIEQLADSEINAKSNGWGFGIYTEGQLGMSERAILAWADRLRSEIGEFDWVALRKQQNRAKAKKHYDTRIAPNTITVPCGFCQEEHSVLAVTYDKNLARNGRYICEREGGFLSGKKPKRKKVNPHAAEGKKRCNGECGLVRPLHEFGDDKTKSDGKSTRCKECRAKKAMASYRATNRLG